MRHVPQIIHDPSAPHGVRREACHDCRKLKAAEEARDARAVERDAYRAQRDAAIRQITDANARAEKAEAERDAAQFYLKRAERHLELSHEQVEALEDERDAAIRERDEWRSDFNVLQKAIVGETGASGILTVEKMHKRIADLEAALREIIDAAENDCVRNSTVQDARAALEGRDNG